MANLFDFASKEKEIEKNEALMAAENFWTDQKKAQSIIRATNAMKSLKENFDHLTHTFSDLSESIQELSGNFDQDLAEMTEDEYKEALKAFEKYEIQVLLSHQYDQHNAILEIHPGAGGTEAMDWAGMLYRMYCRWAERKGYKVTVLNYLEGEEAGVKSCSILIEGPMVYGYLKAENGVHRLVRISPFDSAARRHTSFASVEVIPQFEDDMDITIDDRDLEVVTMRASGAGGQHINKTDSAVRMTHIPTGTVAQCQSERSQIQNREQCLHMLRAKLFVLERQKQEQELNELAGDYQAIEWGSQIRSYVFHPYNMVKDHRTNAETGNVQAVMDGDLELFIQAYLRRGMQGD